MHVYKINVQTFELRGKCIEFFNVYIDQNIAHTKRLNQHFLAN